MDHNARKRHQKDLKDLVRLIAKRFSQDRCAQLAAGLTVSSLLMLVALTAVALSIFSAFHAFTGFSEAIRHFAATNMQPDTGGKMVAFYLDQFSASADRLMGVGILFLAVTALIMMFTVDQALSAIWHVSRPRNLMQRLLIYWLILTLGPLLVGGSLSLTGWLVGIADGYASPVSKLGLVALKVAPLLLTVPAFTFLYWVVPNRFVPVRHAAIGGIVAALAFESMNSFFALYLAHLTAYKLVYNIFTILPVVVLWVYLSWISVLLGALVASSLSHWRSPERQSPDPMAQLYFALCMMRMMNRGLRSGSVRTLPYFCNKLQVGFDYLEQILAKLARANIVSKLAGQGWGMVRDPELVRLGDLHRLFVFDPQSFQVRHDDGGIGEWLKREGGQGMGASSMTLREVFDHAGAAAAHEDFENAPTELLPAQQP